MKNKIQHSIILAALVSTTLSVSVVNAMAKKPVAPPPVVVTPAPTPKPTSTPTPKPSSTPVREPAAVTYSITPAGFNVFNEVSDFVGPIVDTRYQSYRELIPSRGTTSAHVTDSCDPKLTNNYSFSDRISYGVELKMQPARSQLGYVASAFGLESDINKHSPVGLISHPLCNVSSASLNTTLSGKKVPSASTITKMNTFANKMNEYRRSALSGNSDGYKKASRLWSKYMMCLSYMESLTTADTKKSYSVADKYGPSSYRKPAGVKFYEDPLQPAASKLNIGLFQFTPDAGGNVQSCIREWNVLYPSCQISRTVSTAELTRIVGSSMQTFNAFCGAAKVAGVFSVQVNATKAYNTHPGNVNSNGSLKSAAERCVSPHMAVGRGYNHFGPFQNSTGDNLEGLMNCTLAGDY